MAGFAHVATRLWWRRGSSLAVLVVAVVATITAVVGPLYAGAAAESTLRHALVSTPAEQTGLHLQTESDITTDPNAPLRHLLPAGFSAAYHRVVATLQVSTGVRTTDDRPRAVSTVVWRDGFCAHVIVVKGRCPQGADEAMVSKRAADGPLGIALGGTVVLSGLPTQVLGPDRTAESAPLAAKVVGLYVPVSLDDPFWFGIDYFDAHPGSGPTGDGPDTIDTIFADSPAFANAASGTQGSAWLDYYLDPTKVAIGDLAALRHDVATAQRVFPSNAVPGLTTKLDDVLDRAQRARNGLGSGTALVTLQLLLLAWLVLFQVVSASAESRGAEIAVAKLRGLRPRDTALFALGEPVLLLCIATPLGILGGLLATHVLAGVVLEPGIPVHLGLSSIGAAALALLGGLTATAIATRRTLTRPILEEWRRAEEHVSRGARTAVLDLAVATSAVIGLVLLTRHSNRSAHQPSSATLLGPALLVVAVALIGIRGLPVLGQAGARLTRASGRLGLFLAVRQVARRSTGHRFAVLLAVATGVAVFSVVANDVVRHNELNRARAEVGAQQVVTVAPGAGVDLMRAVARADPAGRWAMAAAVWSPVGGNVGAAVMAVDTQRYNAVAAPFPGSATVSRALPRLHVQGAQPVSIGTPSIRVRYTLTARPPLPPTLDVTVADNRGRERRVTGPPVSAGAHSAVVAVGCTSGCRLVDLELDRNISDHTVMRGTWVVQRVEEGDGSQWRPLPAQLELRGGWRGGRQLTGGHDDVRATPGGVLDDFVAIPGGWPSVELTDVPRPLPVLLTSVAIDDPAAAPYVTDLFGGRVDLVRSATVRIVPRELALGAMADLSAAVADLPAFPILAHDQVWLGPQTPADGLARLRAAGLVLGRPDTVAAHVASLRQEGPALALQLFLFASFACSALALAATALALAAGGRRRSFEMAALLAIGVRRRALLRGCILEQALLLGTGLVLGIVPGLLAAGVALPSVPEFDDVSPVALDYAPHVGIVAAFVVGIGVLVLGVATVGGAALLRAAVPSRLREAAP